MSGLITGIIGAGVAVSSFAYNVYNTEQQKQRANTLANQAAVKEKNAEDQQAAVDAANRQQQAAIALRAQQTGNQNYNRSGTILSAETTGSSGAVFGTTGSNKTLLGM